MTTIEHAIVTMVAMLEKNEDHETVNRKFKEMIPWILLPDAIRAYSGPRVMSHFERSPKTTSASWMKFPTAEVLKTLSKENFAEMVEFKAQEGYPSCVIGEDTALNVFDNFNQSHPFYRELRAHLRQDMVLDRVLRDSMIDATDRFEDKFVTRNGLKGKVIGGKTLRKEIATFAQMSYVEAAISVHQAYGIIMDNNWFEENVYPALCEVYSQDLADRTFKYMSLTEEMEERIRTHHHASYEEYYKLNIAGDQFFKLAWKIYEEAIKNTHEELDKFF